MERQRLEVYIGYDLRLHYTLRNSSQDWLTIWGSEGMQNIFPPFHTIHYTGPQFNKPNISQSVHLMVEISVFASGSQKSPWESLLEQAVAKLAVMYISIY